MKKDTYYDKLTKPYQDELMTSLAEFLAIDSVYDESTVSEEHPFGKGVTNALNYIHNLALKDGFKSTNYDNKVVEIISGEGEKNITIMAHADVVPAASGWGFEPFKLTRKGNVLFGRGVADDKGPLLASYYALKALRDNNLLGNYQVRLLVGGNEERGSLCMEHYFHTLKKEAPTFGFSPDADFPLIFAEKGILTFKASKEIKVPELISIKGGEASNSVIERCEVVMECPCFSKYVKKSGLTNVEIDGNKVAFIGKAAHGATPELGVNAGYIALKTLADFTNNNELAFIAERVSSLDGSSFNCAANSHDMGHNSANLGIVNYENSVLTVIDNFRYVNTCSRDELWNNIQNAFKPFSTEVVGEADLLYFPKNSTLISTLLSSYQEETGDLQSEPLAIGGGTYAKETSNVVAFGMQFPGWESNMHSPGESVKEEDLYKAMSVYARAIKDLGNKL